MNDTPLSIPSLAPAWLTLHIGFVGDSGTDYDTVAMVLQGALRSSHGPTRYNLRVTLKPGAQFIERDSDGSRVAYAGEVTRVFDATLGDELQEHDADADPDNSWEPNTVRVEFQLCDDIDCGPAGISRMVRYSDIEAIDIY